MTYLNQGKTELFNQKYKPVLASKSALSTATRYFDSVSFVLHAGVAYVTIKLKGYPVQFNPSDEVKVTFETPSGEILDTPPVTFNPRHPYLNIKSSTQINPQPGIFCRVVLSKKEDFAETSTHIQILRQIPSK